VGEKKGSIGSFFKSCGGRKAADVMVRGGGAHPGRSAGENRVTERVVCQGGVSKRIYAPVLEERDHHGNWSKLRGSFLGSPPGKGGRTHSGDFGGGKSGRPNISSSSKPFKNINRHHPEKPILP